MQTRALTGLLLVFLGSAYRGGAQRSGSTNLALRVGPEARIDPAQLFLQFDVAPEEVPRKATASASFTALVRTLPGRPVRVAASLANAIGPDGPISPSAIRWSGSTVHAAGHARQASCSSGRFGTGSSNDFVEGWTQSGILTCLLTFELTGDPALTPGRYSGTVNLSVMSK